MPSKKLKVRLASKREKLNVNKNPVAAGAKKLNASVAIKKPSKRGLTVNVYNTKGKVTGSITLPKEIFATDANPRLVAQSIRVYLANQRRATASTKTRGEVQGSTRKIWKQKGTGRARHGSIRAPIFVGGGVAFGPKPRDYSLDLPKKMKRVALFSALSARLKEGAITIVAGLEKLEPKTKVMAKTLESLPNESKEKHVLIILPQGGKSVVENVHKAARNIDGVSMLAVTYLNPYEVLRNRLVFMESSISSMQEHFLKGEK